MSLRQPLHGLKQVLTKRADDVVFISALRTPFAKYGKNGGFKDMYPEELLAHVLRATRERLEQQGLDVAGGAVEDIVVGTVLTELGGAKSGSFPTSTGFKAVNRQCASSLQSVTDVALSIRCGMIDMGIAAGVESMTRGYGTRAIPVDLSPFMANSPVEAARDCLMPMGLTSEAVAEQYGVTREEQDEFAVASHAKAFAAQTAGHFDAEIVPILVRCVAPADGTNPAVTTEVLISKDEGIRPSASVVGLAKLKPVFKGDGTGTGTAGNSSQISDGASAMTLTRRDVAERLGLKPIARWVGSCVVGVPPRIMGVGPAFAVPALLKKYGLTKDEIDIWELNEAFASQSLMVMKTLDLEIAAVNPKGGAIALGHPLGATGGRLISSLITELHRTGKQVGVATLCMGTGAGKATLIVAE